MLASDAILKETHTGASCLRVGRWGTLNVEGVVR